MRTTTTIDPRKKASLTFTPARGMTRSELSSHLTPPDHESQSPAETSREAVTQPNLSHDFSRISVHPPSSAMDAQALQPTTQSCPLALASPRACPFGGACHTCPTRVQTKLTINQPGDEYEQEADRVAEQVMRMPDTPHREVPVTARLVIPAIQRTSRLDEDEEGEEILQRKELSGQVNPTTDSSVAVPSIVREVLRSPGQPLDQQTRAFFEPRLGHNFSRVRLHADARAAESARSVNALAYTVGKHVVFGAGQYASGVPRDGRLLAHELAHVVQQGSADAEARFDRLYRPSGSHPCARLQRAVVYQGAYIQNDIDPLDPSTAPAEEPGALGHTAFVVDGQDFKPMDHDTRLRKLFPLPGAAPLSGSCFLTNREINVASANRVRILTPAPWTRTVPKSELSTMSLFRGALRGRAACSGTGTATIRLRGMPNDLALRAWVLRCEMQHASDDRCLVQRYIQSYAADVQALPTTFPRGYLGLGSCESRLNEQLRREARLRAFTTDYRAFTDDYERSSHRPRAPLRVGTACNTITLTLTTPTTANIPRDCHPWSPAQGGREPEAQNTTSQRKATSYDKATIDPKGRPRDVRLAGGTED
jgi:hypothetical protein